jgi:hypothetical protein
VAIEYRGAETNPIGCGAWGRYLGRIARPEPVSPLSPETCPGPVPAGKGAAFGVRQGAIRRDRQEFPFSKVVLIFRGFPRPRRFPPRWQPDWRSEVPGPGPAGKGAVLANSDRYRQGFRISEVVPISTAFLSPLRFSARWQPELGSLTRPAALRDGPNRAGKGRGLARFVRGQPSGRNSVLFGRFEM